MYFPVNWSLKSIETFHRMFGTSRRGLGKSCLIIRIILTLNFIDLVLNEMLFSWQWLSFNLYSGPSSGSIYPLTYSFFKITVRGCVSFCCFSSFKQGFYLQRGLCATICSWYSAQEQQSK